MTLRGAWIQTGQCVQVSKGELACSIETLDVGPASNLMKFNFMHQHVSCSFTSLYGDSDLSGLECM